MEASPLGKNTPGEDFRFRLNLWKAAQMFRFPDSDLAKRGG